VERNPGKGNGIRGGFLLLLIKTQRQTKPTRRELESLLVPTRARRKSEGCNHSINQNPRLLGAGIAI